MIELAGYQFEGPSQHTSSLTDRSGVYAVLTSTGARRYRVVDVGESARVRSRVENHDRTACWRRNATSGGLYYAAHYTPGMHQSGRKAIEKKVRDKYDPPCGEL